MKPSMLIVFLLIFLSGCEGNTKGQNRHDPNHHDKVMQKDQK